MAVASGSPSRMSTTRFPVSMLLARYSRYMEGSDGFVSALYSWSAMAAAISSMDTGGWESGYRLPAFAERPPVNTGLW